MKKSSFLRVGGLCVLVGVASCADSIPVEPTAVVGQRAVRSLVDQSEVSSVSIVLGEINAQLAADGADSRVLKAELIYAATDYDAATSTVIIANDRFKGIGTEWVPGDPRRGGRIGITYALAIGELTGSGALADLNPFTRNPDGSNLHQVPFSELQVHLEDGMASWRNQRCTDKPVQLVAATGPNPDFFDDAVLGPVTLPAGSRTTANYAQPADIVQGGWLSNTFFTRLAGPSGSGIIGVTLTSAFVNPATGTLTDIDNNKLADTRRAEIYYNTRFAWGTTEALNVVDFHSIITHESGHAFGLNHFGKVFVTKKDAEGGIAIDEIKYAPLALMNAVYVTGRNDIASTDIGQYCNVFGKKN